MDVVTEAPAVEAPVAPVESSGDVETSLADHEAQFGPKAGKREPTADAAPDASAEPGAADGVDKDPATGRFRSRATSQRAGAKDVDAIGEYTRRLRQAESDLGLKIEKQPGESDRVFSLRRQAEIAEALRDAKRPAPKPPTPQPRAAEPPARESIAAPKPQTVPFAEQEPDMNAFANDPNPLGAYTKAVAAWEWRRMAHEAQQQWQAQQSEQQRAAMLAEGEQFKQSFLDKVKAYGAKRPEFFQKIDRIEDIDMPPILADAIGRHDTPGEILEYLVDHEDEFLNLVFQTSHLEYSEPSSRLVRRRLDRYARAIDVQKGASPPVPAPVLVAPRPPTPLGTGPLKTADEPPAEDAPLSAHEKAFGPKSRYGSRGRR